LLAANKPALCARIRAGSSFLADKNTNNSRMHDSGEKSLYSKAGMYRKGKRLYKLGPSISCWRDFWEMDPNVLYLHIRFPAIQVWQIQRAMRSFLQRRLEQRNLTLAMSMHARLRAHSSLAQLSPDLLALVAANKPCFIPL
jgi:hypothetical protein